ncbi:hypothetical protein [Sporisorium scitamineum]|uniref:Uncharacterized protein n=1 Tax=Sporisorium scitamineum TaxID=49012 RepID=A0A0F7RVU0_9BASI|nr:hypothetical protein [Sporisorium scitamineum]
MQRGQRLSQAKIDDRTSNAEGCAAKGASRSLVIVVGAEITLTTDDFGEALEMVSRRRADEKLSV